MTGTRRTPSLSRPVIIKRFECIRPGIIINGRMGPGTIRPGKREPDTFSSRRSVSVSESDTYEGKGFSTVLWCFTTALWIITPSLSVWTRTFIQYKQVVDVFVQVWNECKDTCVNETTTTYHAHYPKMKDAQQLMSSTSMQDSVYKVFTKEFGYFQRCGYFQAVSFRPYGNIQCLTEARPPKNWQ